MKVSCRYQVKRQHVGQAPAAHTYNPRYSGGRDQEDHSSKPAWANGSQDPNLEKKKKHNKKDWWSGSRCMQEKKKQQNAVSRSLSETVRAQVSEMPIWQVRL
jgi:hypothetical protein